MAFKESRKNIEIREAIRKRTEETKKIAVQIGIDEKPGMTVDAILCATGKHMCDLRKLSGFYGRKKFINELERVRSDLKKRDIPIVGCILTPSELANIVGLCVKAELIQRKPEK